MSNITTFRTNAHALGTLAERRDAAKARQAHYLARGPRYKAERAAGEADAFDTAIRVLSQIVADDDPRLG